ncbi:MAG: hypothetical protein PHD40_01895 [Syntrophomonadaceae bacterium]|nr:hypothetical protein [Syntrophomonadaceae bacterium]
MPGMKFPDSARTISLVLILVLLAVIVISRHSNTLLRAAVGQGISLQTAGFSQMESDNFIIKYTGLDSSYSAMIAEAAEEAYAEVSQEFNREPRNKTILVVYPDSPSLANSFGWDKNEKALGVYWAGSIRIVSPEEWMSDPLDKQEFSREGPMVHEFVHLMVDELTGGNYNRWWTEGIAQYYEKKITGFEFAEPSLEDGQLKFYDLSVLGKQFDQTDQAIAYWESLQVVEYIVNYYGEEDLFTIMNYLGQGCSLEKSISKALGLEYHEFAQDFYQFLENR